MTRSATLTTSDAASAKPTPNVATMATDTPGDPDGFDDALNRDRRPEDWVQGFEEVWRELGHDEDKINAAPDPIDVYLFSFTNELRRLIGALSLRVGTRYTRDEMYLQDEGYETLHEAIDLLGAGRGLIFDALGHDRAMELAKLEARQFAAELNLDLPDDFWDTRFKHRED